MNSFPRTTVGGVSLSRMIIGTNWFLGFSHTTPSKDQYICECVRDRKKMADIIEVFLRSGVDTIMGLIAMPPLAEAIKEAEDRTGLGVIVISTPAFPLGPETPSKGMDKGAVDAIVEEQAKLGARFCFPHTSTTDALLDRCTRKIRHIETITESVRAHGMIPGLSTHMPEAIIYSDESGIDVETYISLYNSMGFLMQVEVDWVARVIQEAKKPVMTIKPMAAGQLRPFQGLAFAWSTLRDIDMVTVGTMAPKEAAELIEISLNLLEKRGNIQALQETRSKASVKSV
ncbi:MAG: hypothetical protein NTU83_02960 [Candidatus Hydrogenedentes bacterium]|nr:hypothetical protein [Candidatus Hydrogenedentota bacterium]